MSKQKNILIGIGNTKTAMDGFVNAWQRAEEGLPVPVQEPVNQLHFEDTSTLFKYLSPRRFELMQHLRISGPLSIRKLATQLRRDYKNVHSDVKDLLSVGLIEENDDHLITVPWDVIITKLALLAKAK